jgi:hypothetical protein
MENLIRLIIAYALIVMLWASYSLIFVNSGVGAPMVVLGITSILLTASIYLLRITK